jgi:tagaturonate reductase
VGLRGNEEYPIKDDHGILTFYDAHKADDSRTLANAVLSNTSFWGEDLTAINDLLEAVTKDLEIIKVDGTYALMKQCIK